MRIELTVIDELTGQQVVEVVNDGCSTPITTAKISGFVSHQQLNQYLDPNDGHIITRIERRGEIYPRGILQVCQDVHMTSTGAFERNPADQTKDVELLQIVLDTWDHKNECCFDSAVKTLVGITIAEAVK